MAEMFSIWKDGYESDTASRNKKHAGPLGQCGDTGNATSDAGKIPFNKRRGWKQDLDLLYFVQSPGDLS